MWESEMISRRATLVGGFVASLGAPLSVRAADKPIVVMTSYYG
jgi:hypothetical protein